MLSFGELRRREFGRLDAQHHAYLDYTGAALYGASQVRAHLALLEEGVFGNPHSDSAPSRASTEAIDAARRTVLHFFDVDESTHDVVFTANTTAAIKLVAESYPFGSDSAFVVSADNHNSVLGIREYARRAGARVRVLPLDEELRLRDPLSVLDEEHGGLLAFPAQSNFSGVRHPLSLVDAAHARGFDVLIDVAAYAPSHAVSLRECPADFAALSFYKLFGYPTGIGALVARREALSRLRRPWFAGGTVLYASVAADRHRLRPSREGFEDGTPNFLGIAALDAGFALLSEVGLPRLSAHVARLTRMFLEELTSMPHVRVYGPRDMTDRGGTVAFNVHDVPYGVIETRARESGVSLRGGCFCNPGASEAAFELEGARVASCLDDLGEDFSVERFSACTESAVGAVRASFGMATSEDDVRRALDVIASFQRRRSFAI
ncbi:MAG TPA: aminotransferase class V-fold PLP-dependent enzyme [Thermoanaerobaculia bacterium]|jgi:selenocysteine lyase/cysteine desulfurase|nr:aminotransferase class V-fold PLP-dependent enzyme [Thermoanaerobaculia bacterium]